MIIACGEEIGLMVGSVWWKKYEVMCMYVRVLLTVISSGSECLAVMIR